LAVAVSWLPLMVQTVMRCFWGCCRRGGSGGQEFRAEELFANGVALDWTDGALTRGLRFLRVDELLGTADMSSLVNISTSLTMSKRWRLIRLENARQPRC
jgi:hypothetical protein